jgi:hypothetical protein
LSIANPHNTWIRNKRSPLHWCAGEVTGGGDPWRRLRREGKLELAHQQLLIRVEFRVAGEYQGTPVGGWEVNVKHLHCCQFIEHDALAPTLIALSSGSEKF